jgi:hypothetical protein
MAQTPDGETPAVEEVCDGLEGKAYGLCNAYCEAKDCGEAAEETGHKSCQNLKDNYFDLTGEEIFPCEEAIFECPCLISMIEEGDSLEEIFNTFDNNAPTELGSAVQDICYDDFRVLEYSMYYTNDFNVLVDGVSMLIIETGTVDVCAVNLIIDHILLKEYQEVLTEVELAICYEEFRKFMFEDPLNICE